MKTEKFMLETRFDGVSKLAGKISLILAAIILVAGSLAGCGKSELTEDIFETATIHGDEEPSAVGEKLENIDLDPNAITGEGDIIQIETETLAEV